MRASVLGIFALQILTIYLIYTTRSSIMADIDTLSTALDSISTEIDKISAETTTLVAELQAANQNPAVDLTAVIAKAQAIEAKLQAVDDLVPDAPVADPAPTDTPTA